VLPTALNRFLRLPIDEKNGVRFRAYKRNNGADDHCDGEHIESILHEKKGRQGKSAKQRDKKRPEKSREVKVRVNSGKNWNVTVGTYLGGAPGLICMYDGSAPSFSRSAEQKTCCSVSRQCIKKESQVRGNLL